MAVKLVLPWKVRRGHLYSATDQLGVRAVGCVPAATNEGHLRPHFSGLISAELAHRLEITQAGDVGEAKWKLSLDAGTTWKGHSASWTDAEGGAANSRKTVLSSVNSCVASKIALADTLGYEQYDTAFVAVAVNNAVQILKTTTLLRDGSAAMAAWTEVCADAVGDADVTYRPQLIQRNGRLFLFYQVGGAIYVRMSRASATADLGETWGAAYTVIGSTVRDGADAFDVCLLPTEQFFVVFDRASTSLLVQCRVARSVNSWSASKTVVTAEDASYYVACAYITALEKTMVVVSGGSGENFAMYECEDDNPAATSATWAAHLDDFDKDTDPMWSPWIAEGHDGTYWIGGRKDTDAVVWVGKDGAQVTTEASLGEAASCYGGVVGGAVWVLAYNSTTDILGAVFSRYWTAYSAGVNDVLTGAGDVLAADDARYVWGGSDGVDGDYWDADTVADYGAERMVALTPARPARSVSNDYAWSAVFDLGAGNPLVCDTLLVQANVRKVLVQFADGTSEPTWTGGGAPTAHEVSFVVDSFTPNAESPGIVTASADRWTPGEHAGRILYSANREKQVQIVGNDERRLFFVGDDLDGHTGALEILHPRAWLSITEANTRWMRVSIEAQVTLAGYYEVAVLLGGVAIDCDPNIRAYPTERQRVYGDPFERDSDPMSTGPSLITPIDAPVEDWRLLMLGGSLSQKKGLGGAQFGTQATVIPFGLIPDSSDTHRWALVRFPRVAEWSTLATEWELETVS